MTNLLPMVDFTRFPKQISIFSLKLLECNQVQLVAVLLVLVHLVDHNFLAGHAASRTRPPEKVSNWPT